MKCPSCGAESQEKFCEYCGSEMPQEKATVNITNNYYDTVTRDTIDEPSIGKCPKCGNTKISFKRERVSTSRKSSSRKKYIGSGRTGQSVSNLNYRTIGLCQNCGHTWNPNANNSSGTKKKIWLWVLGWIFIFPVPLTILLLRKKDMKPVLKYSIIAIAWLLFFIIGLSGNGNETTSTNANSKSDTTQVSQTINATESKTITISEQSTTVKTNIATENEDETIIENKTTKGTTKKSIATTKENKTTSAKKTTTTNKTTSTKKATTTKSTTKTTTQKQEAMVWIPTNGGERYHSHSDCSKMENPDYVSLSKAESLGFTPCGRCY